MSTIAPSKKYLFRVLKIFLGQHNNTNIGIDLASENFKNSRYFKTKKYIGVDINLKEILYGLNNFHLIKSYGILWDFTKKNRLGNSFADVVVSTNTLSHIKSSKKKINAVKNFIEFTSNNGSILIQTEVDDITTHEIIKLFYKNFKNVKISYYHNFFSRIFLTIFVGQLTKNRLAIFLNKIKLNYLISLTENLTSNLKFFNKKIIIIGDKKNKFQKKIIKIKFKRLNKFL